MKEETIFDETRTLRQVWSEPIVQLSKFLQPLDVGLAKICRKMDIPVPGAATGE